MRLLNVICDVDTKINPEQAREEFRTSVSKDGGTGVKDFMHSLGLGGWVDEVISLVKKLNLVFWDNAEGLFNSFSKLNDF